MHHNVPHPLSCQSSYSEATVILREGYRRNSAIRARVIIPDSGVSDYGESELDRMDEMPMNEPIDENEQAFVNASGISQVYPTWVAKEAVDAIDRIRRQSLSSGTILEGQDRLPV
jgi:hypothetical protein